VEWDDDGLDDEPGSPLLPPDDRLWRHPSEVAETSPTMVRGVAAPGGSPRVVTVVALTSCISILITLGVVTVVRPFRIRGESSLPTLASSSSATPSGGLSSVGDVAALTAQLRPAIAHVQAMGAGEGGADALGSGVIFRSDGMMLTAHHVVDGASAVRVVLDDGRSVMARLVGGDADTDIALLDLDGDSFPVAELASGGVVGEPAITIGASRTTGTSVSPLVRSTMVSALGQEAAIEGRKLVDMIRTDSAMAAGCSGGALVDRTGRVIAIAASNVSTADGETIGYATPIAVATAVAEQLMATGRVVRGWLGVDGASRNGAYVHGVRSGSPAAAAGIVAGDVITAIDGVGVATMSALVARLRATKPGDTVRLSVVRGASTFEVRATLSDRPAD
jgi:S1-C subfamily serine protease